MRLDGAFFKTALAVSIFLRPFPLDQELRGLGDVLVAAAAEVRDDELVGAHLRRALEDGGDAVRAFERGDDAFSEALKSCAICDRF